MRPFDYTRATDVEQAVTLVAETPGARFLGGGTNLVDLIRRGAEAPDFLVDVTGLPLAEVEEVTVAGEGWLRVGAVVSNATSPITRSSAAVTRCWRRPCSRAPPDSCAPWPRSGATSSSAPAAPTSRIS